MKILVTGKGSSGSWAIRGEQLGRAIGATVQARAQDFRGFDAVVVVKRMSPELLERVRGVPLIWDLVDLWPQPDGNDWNKAECMSWLSRQIECVRPAAIVAATEAMASDCRGFGVPVLSLPHHARPEQGLNPVREKVTTVGYEGSEQHLGAWLGMLAEECKFRGWRFVVNPDRLADLDIVVAVRDRTGYAPMSWKSNVKLANAQATGTPCILAKEAGYIETASGYEMWASDMHEMRACLDSLVSLKTRREVSAGLKSVTLSLDEIASRYVAWLQALRF